MFLSLLNRTGFFAVSREDGAFVNDPALAYQALPLVAFVFLSVVEDARDPGGWSSSSRIIFHLPQLMLSPYIR